jgi:hypothetical protein
MWFEYQHKTRFGSPHTRVDTEEEEEMPYHFTSF